MNDINKITEAIFDLSMGTRALAILNELYQMSRVTHEEYCEYKDRLTGQKPLRKDLGYLETRFPIQSALTPEDEAYGKLEAGIKE